ncbi:MAG: hypothetical protein [Bacteriophage sp.]|nr:MAG: hypothetical protein [Bacteriophage sp.]
MALFGVYIDGRNRTDALIEKNNTDHFNLYKYTRDADDDIRKELSDLKAELAVTQFILGNSDPLLYPSEKMTNSIHYCKTIKRNYLRIVPFLFI